MKRAVILTMIFLLFFGGCGCNTVNNNKLCSEKIVQNIYADRIDIATDLLKDLDKPLSAEEKQLITTALSDRINQKHTSTLSSFENQKGLVNKETINEFEEYKKIVDGIDITSVDCTNVDDYIYTIVSFGKFEKYNDVWMYYQYALDDWCEGKEYWGRACHSNSDYTKRIHLEKARDCFNQCISQAENYDHNSFGISEIKSMAQAYVDGINCYFATGSNLQIDESIALNYQNISNIFTAQTREFQSALIGIPKNTY